MPSFGLQKTAYWNAKGHLLEAGRSPLGNRRAGGALPDGDVRRWGMEHEEPPLHCFSPEMVTFASGNIKVFDNGDDRI